MTPRNDGRRVPDQLPHGDGTASRRRRRDASRLPAAALLGAGLLVLSGAGAGLAGAGLVSAHRVREAGQRGARVARTASATTTSSTSTTSTTTSTTSTTTTSTTTTTVAGVASKITSSDHLAVVVGRLTRFEVTTSGHPTARLIESGALPGGLIYHDNGNGTATLVGTPQPSDRNGDWTVTITAANGVGTPDVQELTITVERIPAFTSASSLTVKAGAHVRFTVRASGYPTPRLTASGSFPPGLAFRDNHDGTARLSGTTPAGTHGDYTLELVAANGVGSPVVQHLHVAVAAKPAPPPRPVPTGTGYWYVTSGGELLAQGSARPLPSRGRQHPRDVVAIAATPDRRGYYLLSGFGGVFCYGDARWYGSLTRLHLHTPAVAIGVEPGDRGYYLVTKAGNVFNFGGGRFYGSLAHARVPAVTGFALTPDGKGYWVASVKGNVWNFGDAHFYGSLAHSRVPPVSAFAPTPTGNGYWAVTTAGNVFAFGHAGDFGSLASRHVAPVTAFAANPDGRGYWIVTSAGNVFNLGDARFYGSSAHHRLAGKVTGFALDF